MNPRERMLAIVLLTAILLGGGGLLGKLLLLDPLNDRSERIRGLQKQIGELETRKQQIVSDLPKLERAKQLSLPADLNLARREYAVHITEMLRQSGFAPGSFSVSAATNISAKDSPTLSGRKDPIYTKLTFTVQAPGELKNIVDFLERFYDAPLLHGIKTISIRRPQTSSSPQQRQSELEFTLTLEALVVSGVDARPQLLPNVSRRLLVIEALTALRGGPPGLPLAGWAAGPGGPLGPGLLADPSREYEALTAKNIFFGPRPRARQAVDVAQFIRLTDITKRDTKVQAFLYDVYNNKATRLWVDFPFSVKDEKGENLVSGTVLRIDERDVYFRANGKFYGIHIGQNLKEAMAKPLKESRAKELNLEKKENEKEERKGSPGSYPPASVKKNH